MMKEKILRGVIGLAGILSLAVFVITKSEFLMDAVTQNMYTDGDLYRFTKVRAFKTPLSAPDNDPSVERNPDPDTTSLIIIGDSFMETRRGHKPFPRLLADRLGMDVSVVYAGYAPQYFDPVYFCWNRSLDPARKRIILLERVERYIINNYYFPSDEDTASFMEVRREYSKSWMDEIEQRYFTDAETNVEVVLFSSDITSPIVEAWNTLRFNVLGQISDETPLYSLHPPFLFYKEETAPGMHTSFYYPHPDRLVDQIADNLARMDSALRSNYNAVLLFMPIPSAYTLYHTMINNDTYDNYLPRLCRELEKRGVKTIQLYDLFRSSPKVLYLPTDTHWNADGARLATDQAAAVVAGLRDSLLQPANFTR